MSSAPFAVNTLNVFLLGPFVNQAKSYIKEDVVLQLKPASSRFSVGFQNDFDLCNGTVIPLFLGPFYLAGVCGRASEISYLNLYLGS